MVATGLSWLDRLIGRCFGTDAAVAASHVVCDAPVPAARKAAPSPHLRLVASTPEPVVQIEATARAELTLVAPRHW